MSAATKTERDVARLARRIAKLEQQAAIQQATLARLNEIVARLARQTHTDAPPR